MISELLAYDFMQRYSRRDCYQYLFANFGAFLNSCRQSLMSDTLSHVSLAGVAVGIFFGTINHLDDSCGCGYCLFGFGISQG